MRIWVPAVEKDLTLTPATPVAPGPLVQLGLVPVAGAFVLVLEVDRVHKPAALPVVRGSMGPHGTVPYLSVIRPSLRTSHLGCVMFPSAVAWMMAQVLLLVAAMITSCPRVVVALFPVTAFEELVLLIGFLPLVRTALAIFRLPSRTWTPPPAGHVLAFVSARLFLASPVIRTAGLPVCRCLPMDPWTSIKYGCTGGATKASVQCITTHAFGSEGHRRFLLRSDEDGHTWVSVAESLRGLPRRHRRRRASRVTSGSGDVAVISSDSPLPVPPGDVSADLESHADASLHVSSLPDPVKTENDGTLPDTMEAAAGVDVSVPVCLVKTEEDVPGSVRPDLNGVSTNQEASDNWQDDSDPDLSEHDSIAPTVVHNTDVPIVGIPDESASQASVSPGQALPLTQEATCCSAQPPNLFLSSDGPAPDEVISGRSSSLACPSLLTLNPGLLFCGLILQALGLAPWTVVHPFPPS